MDIKNNHFGGERALVRFNKIRRCLGHEAVLPDDEIGPDMGYYEYLSACDLLVDWRDASPAVLPRLQFGLHGAELVHVTGSGHTTIRATQYHVWVTREADFTWPEGDVRCEIRHLADGFSEDIYPAAPEPQRRLAEPQPAQTVTRPDVTKYDSWRTADDI
jgi:hypothetical protein